MVTRKVRREHVSMMPFECYPPILQIAAEKLWVTCYDSEAEACCPCIVRCRKVEKSLAYSDPLIIWEDDEPADSVEMCGHLDVHNCDECNRAALVISSVTLAEGTQVSVQIMIALKKHQTLQWHALTVRSIRG